MSQPIILPPYGSPTLLDLDLLPTFARLEREKKREEFEALYKDRKPSDEYPHHIAMYSGFMTGNPNLSPAQHLARDPEAKKAWEWANDSITGKWDFVFSLQKMTIKQNSPSMTSQNGYQMIYEGLGVVYYFAFARKEDATLFKLFTQ